MELLRKRLVFFVFGMFQNPLLYSGSFETEVEKIVEVPQITYEERIVEVPQREVREIIKQVPKPVVQYVDKKLGSLNWCVRFNAQTQLGNKKLCAKMSICSNTQARPRRVRRVPKHIYNYYESVQDKPTILRQEVPVEVPEILAVETLTEVPKPQYEKVPKEIPMCLGNRKSGHGLEFIGAEIGAEDLQ